MNPEPHSLPAPVAERGLLSLLLELLEHWRFIGTVALGLGILTAAILSLSPSEYLSDASFVPETQAHTPVQGLAAQFGLENTDQPTESPDFYADLIKSRTVLDAAVLHNYKVLIDGQPAAGTLLDLLHINGRSPALRLENGVKALRKLIVVLPNRRTSAIKVQVSTESPDLSKVVVNEILDLVGDFNLNKRQTRGRIEREFLANRVEIARKELKDADHNLQEYVDTHRQYRLSPVQVFEAEELEREVKVHEQVFTTLTASLEQARVDEVRNTPAITVVDSARVAARRESKGTIALSAAMTIAGAMIAVLCILGMNWIEAGASSGAPERVILHQRVMAVVNRFPRAFRLSGVTPSSVE